MMIQLNGSDLHSLYNTRFSVVERIRKQQLWKIFCEDFLQRYVPASSTVLDIGAGTCEFINYIHAKKKYALDLNPATSKHANSDVTVFKLSADKMDKVLRGTVNVAFMSNFLEHLDNKDVVYQILKKTYRVLSPGAKLLIMQPDIKRAGNQYWDFFDHKTPITAKSLSEALLSVGFSIKQLIDPFMPYSTNISWIPTSVFLLKIYLRFRPLQLLFGKQFFVLAEKPS